MRSRSFAYARTPAREPQPLSAMNITPLIDVLLVLLVMMILTIPMMTNTIPVELPQPGPVNPNDAVIHRIDLSAGGALSLDGAPISDAALPARLAALRADPNNELQIAADPQARYERFDQALAIIKRANITRLGFVGNERFKDF